MGRFPRFPPRHDLWYNFDECDNKPRHFWKRVDRIFLSRNPFLASFQVPGICMSGGFRVLRVNLTAPVLEERVAGAVICVSGDSLCSIPLMLFSDSFR